MKKSMPHSGTSWRRIRVLSLAFCIGLACAFFYWQATGSSAKYTDEEEALPLQIDVSDSAEQGEGDKSQALGGQHVQQQYGGKQQTAPSPPQPHQETDDAGAKQTKDHNDDRERDEQALAGAPAPPPPPPASGKDAATNLEQEQEQEQLELQQHLQQQQEEQDRLEQHLKEAQEREEQKLANPPVSLPDVALPHTRPRLVWWHAVLPGDEAEPVTRECAYGTCTVELRQPLANSSQNDVAAYLFYGPNFAPGDLPLPRFPASLWGLFAEDPEAARLLSHPGLITLFNLTSTFSRHSHRPLTLQHMLTPASLSAAPLATFADKSRPNRAAVLLLSTRCNDDDTPGAQPSSSPSPLSSTALPSSSVAPPTADLLIDAHDQHNPANANHEQKHARRRRQREGDDTSKTAAETAVAGGPGAVADGAAAAALANWEREAEEEHEEDRLHRGAVSAGLKVDRFSLCNESLLQDPRATIELISRYKFTIIRDDDKCPDFFDQPLFLALMAGSVPLYFGHPSLREWFPSRTMVVLPTDFSTPEAMWEQVASAVNNETLYEAYHSFRALGPAGWMSEMLTEMYDESSHVSWLDVLDATDQGSAPLDEFECFVCDSVLRPDSRPPPADPTHLFCPCTDPDVCKEQDDVAAAVDRAVAAGAFTAADTAVVAVESALV